MDAELSTTITINLYQFFWRMADNTYGDNIKSLMTSVVEMPELGTKILIFLVIVFCFVLAVLVIFSTYWNVEIN